MSRKPQTLRRWETLGASSVYDCRVFSVTEHRRRSPRTGELHDFYVLESSDWVNIVPLTARLEDPNSARSVGVSSSTVTVS